MESGILPQVSIKPLALAKQNPNDRLVLEGFALIPAGRRTPAFSEGITFQWESDGLDVRTLQPLDLASPNVSSTGNQRTMFVFKPNVLIPGATVKMKLVATTMASSYSEITVVMNRGPYGGDLELSGFSGSLKAPHDGHHDYGCAVDHDDTPLTYSFAYGPAGTSESAAKALSPLFAEGQYCLSKPPAGNWTRSSALSTTRTLRSLPSPSI